MRSLWHARSVAAAAAALRPAAMQIADHSGVFFVCVPAPHQGFLEGSKHGESTICSLTNFTAMGVLKINPKSNDFIHF
jgi:hypothetical protein